MFLKLKSFWHFALRSLSSSGLEAPTATHINWSISLSLWYYMTQAPLMPLKGAASAIFSMAAAAAGSTSSLSEVKISVNNVNCWFVVWRRCVVCFLLSSVEANSNSLILGGLSGLGLASCAAGSDEFIIQIWQTSKACAEIVRCASAKSRRDAIDSSLYFG